MLGLLSFRRLGGQGGFATLFHSMLAAGADGTGAVWLILVMLCGTAAAQPFDIHLGLVCMEAASQRFVNKHMRETCDHVINAVNRINDKSDGFFDALLPNHRIVLHERHPPKLPGRASPSCAPTAARQVYSDVVAAAAQQGGVLSAVIAGHCSDNLAEVSLSRGNARTVIFSGSSTAVAPFDDEATHANIVRLLSDEERRARAFAAFARNYQWHRVGVIDDGSIWGVSARSAFESAHGNIPGATVVTNANLPRSVCSILQDANWTAPEAEEVLDALVADGVKVVFAAVSPKCARVLLGASHRRGLCTTAGLVTGTGYVCTAEDAARQPLDGAGYQWLLPWMDASMITFDDGLTTDLDALHGAEGAIGMHEGLSRESAIPIVSAYSPLWMPYSSSQACHGADADVNRTLCDEDEQPGAPRGDLFADTYTALWLDTVVEYAHALDRHLTGTSAAPTIDNSFHDALYAQVVAMPAVVGVSGAINIGANGDRRGSFDIKSMQITSAGRGHRGGSRRQLATPIVSMCAPSPCIVTPR